MPYAFGTKRYEVHKPRLQVQGGKLDGSLEQTSSSL